MDPSTSNRETLCLILSHFHRLVPILLPYSMSMFEKYLDYFAPARAVPAAVAIIIGYILYVVFAVSPAVNPMLCLVDVRQEDSKGLLLAVVPNPRTIARTSY